MFIVMAYNRSYDHAWAMMNCQELGLGHGPDFGIRPSLWSGLVKVVGC